MMGRDRVGRDGMRWYGMRTPARKGVFFLWERWYWGAMVNGDGMGGEERRGPAREGLRFWVFSFFAIGCAK